MAPRKVTAIAAVIFLVTVIVEATDSMPDDATMLKMKVRELKAILEKKGPDAACLACTSKQEYVARIHETIDWADATPEPTPAADEPSMEDLRKMFAPGEDDERMKDLKKKLREAGIDTSKLFTASGLNRDEMAKEKEKWENMREDVTAGAEDVAAGAEEAKSDL